MPKFWEQARDVKDMRLLRSPADPEKFFADYSRMITRLANKIYRLGFGESVEDLLQIGALALFEAKERYKRQRTRFSTYAYQCITGAMMASTKGRDCIRLEEAAPDEECPPAKVDKGELSGEESDIEEAEDQGVVEVGAPADVLHIEGGIAGDDVCAVNPIAGSDRRVRFMRRLVSLDEPHGGEVDGDVQTLYNTIPAPQTDTIRETQLKELWEVVETLPEKQRVVLKLRYSDGKTLEDTGKELGITRERVRQIEAKALRLLKIRVANPLLTRRLKAA